MSVSEEEQRIVELIDEGYSRYDIADLIEKSPSVVRKMIHRMCRDFNCLQHELPNRVMDVGPSPSEI